MTTRSPVGPDDRKRADSVADRDCDRSRPAHPPVGRGEHGDAPVPDRVRIREIAAAALRARGAVVADDPVLVEGHAARVDALDRDNWVAPRESVARAADREARDLVLDRERGDEPRAGRRVVRDDRIACTHVQARGNALLREAGKEPAPPGAAVVARDCEPDVVRAAVDAAADLVRDHGRPPDGEAVRLDLSLVLPGRRRVRIAGEPPPDELAVGRDDVGQVGVHDVEAGAAADGVPGAVVLDRDPVDPASGGEAVAAGPAVQEVGSGERGQPVSAATPEQYVRPRRSHEPVAPVRSLDRRRGRGAAQDQEQREHDGRDTHPRTLDVRARMSVS